MIPDTWFYLCRNGKDDSSVETTNALIHQWWFDFVRRFSILPFGKCSGLYRKRLAVNDVQIWFISNSYFFSSVSSDDMRWSKTKTEEQNEKQCDEDVKANQHVFLPSNFVRHRLCEPKVCHVSFGTSNLRSNELCHRRVSRERSYNRRRERLFARGWRLNEHRECKACRRFRCSRYLWWSCNSRDISRP